MCPAGVASRESPNIPSPEGEGGRGSSGAGGAEAHDSLPADPFSPLVHEAGAGPGGSPDAHDAAEQGAVLPGVVQGGGGAVTEQANENRQGAGDRLGQGTGVVGWPVADGHRGGARSRGSIDLGSGDSRQLGIGDVGKRGKRR